jgi:hypothetical protein
VNATNIVVWNVGDDAIDTDQAWSGTLDNFVIITPAGHCFELDGPEGVLIAGHTIKNGEVKASNGVVGAEDLINTDDNSRVSLENIYFTDIIPGQKINRVTFDVGEVTFNNIYLNVDPTTLGDYVNGTVPSGVQAGVLSNTNKSGFGWTWTSI